MEDHQFEDSNDWYEHELQNHRIEWYCNLDDHSPCLSSSELLLHIQEHQPSLQSSMASQDLLRKFQRPIRKGMNICPFCSKPSEKLKCHVSHHMEQMALYVLGGNSQEDLEPGSDASADAKRVDSSTFLSLDDDPIDWDHQKLSEKLNFSSIFPQDGILDEQSTVPDTTEVPWKIPFDILGTLRLTATIIAFLNLASYLVSLKLLRPNGIPASLSGLQELESNNGGLQSVLTQFLEDTKKQNTLGCLSQIERELGAICGQASNICEDLVEQSERFNNIPNIDPQRLFADFASNLKTEILREFTIRIYNLRKKFRQDVILTFSKSPDMLGNIESERIWEHGSMTGALFDKLKNGPEFILEIFPKEIHPGVETPTLGPSFLFSVTELLLNPNFPSRWQQESGQWLPPLENKGFQVPPLINQFLYQYTSSGEFFQVDDYVFKNGQWQNSADAFELTIYRAVSTFWCNPIFMTSTCDPIIYNMADEDFPHNRWWPLSFQHNGSVSRVQEAAERVSLRGTGNKWITDCGLESYLRPSTPNTSALAGNIGTIIGLIALSCPAGQLSTVLLEDRAWWNGCWYGHQRGSGRTEEPRGVIVTIYFDPENPSSTRALLEAVESNGGPLLRAID